MSRTSRARNTEKVFNILQDGECAVCWEWDTRVLVFDHIDPSTKSFAISHALRNNYAWERIAKELEKTQILCANCHAKKTAAEQHWYKV